MKSLKFAFQNIFRHKFVSFAMILTLFLIVFNLNFYLGKDVAQNQYIKDLETDLSTFVSFSTNPAVGCDTTQEPQILTLKNKIESAGLSANIRYVSQKDAPSDFIEVVRQSLGVDIKIDVEEYKEKCILPASLLILAKDLQTSQKIYDIINSTKTSNPSLIKDIVYPKEKAQKLTQALPLIRIENWISLLPLVVVGIILAFIVIQLSTRLRIEEIKIMTLLGAKNHQIKMPYFYEGFIYGFIATLFASICFVVIIIYVRQLDVPVESLNGLSSNLSYLKSKVFQEYLELGTTYLRGQINLLYIAFVLIESLAIAIISGLVHYIVVNMYLNK
jgi:cell division protein FtsX